MKKLTRVEVQTKAREAQERYERAKQSKAVLFLVNDRDNHIFPEELAKLEKPTFNVDDLSAAMNAAFLQRGNRILDRCRVDLRGVELYDADLGGVSLSGMDLRGAYLFKADLCGSNLTNADLSGAELRYAKLREADLSGTNLRGARMHWVDLCGANLTEADLREADLTRAYLHKVELSGTDISAAVVGHTQFGDVDLRAVKGLDAVRHVFASNIDIDVISYISGSSLLINFDEYHDLKTFLERTGIGLADRADYIQLYPLPSTAPDVEEHWLNSRLCVARNRLKQLEENRVMLERQQGYFGMEISIPFETVFRLNAKEIEVFRAIIQLLEAQLASSGSTTDK